MTFRMFRSITTNGFTSTQHRPMSSSARYFANLFRRSDSPPRQVAGKGFRLLDATEKLEEENWKWYSADAYYPVQIGETFQSRYQLLGKLGYGAHSTAWLGRDLRYVSPKSPVFIVPGYLFVYIQGSSICHHKSVRAGQPVCSTRGRRIRTPEFTLDSTCRVAAHPSDARQFHYHGACRPALVSSSRATWDERRDSCSADARPIHVRRRAKIGVEAPALSSRLLTQRRNDNTHRSR